MKNMDCWNEIVEILLMELLLVYLWPRVYCWISKHRCTIRRCAGGSVSI